MRESAVPEGTPERSPAILRSNTVGPARATNPPLFQAVRPTATRVQLRLLRLQRAAGNRTVCGLLAGAQAKLEVGAAGDVFEREADESARHVVQRLSGSDVAAMPGGYQRQSVTVHRREAGSPEGGEVSAETEAAIRRAGQHGTPLAPGVRRQMDSAFGADFSQVRLHDGPDASGLNATLGARAFTVGSDIYFRDGLPDMSRRDGQELLAHELTHTIQQSGSRVVQRVTVGERPFAEGYSTLIGTPEWRKAANSFERRLGAYAYGHPRSKAAAQAAVTRLAEVLRGYYNNDFADLNELWRTAFFKDDTSSAGQVGKELTNDEQLKLLFHGDGNLRELMTAFYNAAYYNSGYGTDLNPSLKAILHDITLTGKWDAAKALDLNVADLRVRAETLLGTARKLKEMIISFVKPDKAHIFAQDIFALGELAGSVQNAAELAMSQVPRSDRTDREKEQGASKKTPREYALMAAPLSERERGYLEAKDKPLTMKGFDVQEVEWDDWNLGSDGLPRLAEAEKAQGVTLSITYEYDNLNKLVTHDDGTPSILKVYKVVPSETTLKGVRTHDLAPGVSGPELPLEWVEGKAWFQMNSNSAWYRDVYQKLGTEVIAGVSGTTTRMMSAMKWLNVPGLDPLDFRLAILGWMLTSEDHSLYEILRGSAFAGFEGGEDTKDGVRMYMNVPPLTTEELRAKVGENKMFPHEAAYMAKVHKGMEDVKAVGEGSRPAGSTTGFAEPGKEMTETGEARYKDIEKKALRPKTGSDKLNSWLTDIGRTAPEVASVLSPAHTVALAGYTGGMHSMLNAVMTMPAILAKRFIQSKLSNTLSFVAENAYLGTIEDKLGRKLTPEETKRQEYLQVHYEEWPSTLDLLGNRDAVALAMSDPTKTQQERTRALMSYQARLPALVDPLYEELKAHANMTVEALQALPPVTGKTVYRGDWKGQISWTYGSDNFEVSQLMSTTMTQSVAEEFAMRYVDSKVGRPILLQMQLTGKGGRNIGYLSNAQHEDEILLMPGTRFRVVTRTMKGAVEHIQLNEV